MKKFVKRAAIGLVCIFIVLGVCGVGAGFWLYGKAQDAMQPPPSPEGTPNIDVYADSIPALSLASDRKTEAVSRQALTSLPEAKPWTRWWWPGGDVTAEAAVQQLQMLHEAGFGGVEIQPFNAGTYELQDEATRNRINSLDSPAYYKTLSAVMEKAEALGMTVDLNHLSGWPAGGPQVRLEDGLQSLAFEEDIIKGGSRIEMPVPTPTPGINAYIMALGEASLGMDLSNFAAKQARLVSVVAARITGGSRSSNPLNFEDTLALDSASLTVLTNHIHDGRLVWDAPEGRWSMIFVYQLPAGQAPVLVAADSSGFVIDHFDLGKIRSHYNFGYGSRTGLDKHYGKAFHGFFNDSLEFQANRLTASDMLAQFKARRGYDLQPYLPVLSIEAFDNFYLRDVAGLIAAPAYRLGEYDDRIRYDYQKTLSDLLVERFVKGSANWANERGLRSRGQTYGVSVDTIRALGANGIPETEQLFAGGSELFMRLAYSAGALYEKPVVTAESFVWKKKAYAVSPRLLKAAADALFIAGVNQVIYHGVPYISDRAEYEEAYGSIGWYPFGGPENDSLFSNNYGPRSPLWGFVPQLNSYISTVQGLLQQGKPAVDVYIYYPYHGFPHALDQSGIARRSFLFDGTMPDDPPEEPKPGISLPGIDATVAANDPRLKWIESIMPLIDAFNERGIVWAWANDDAIIRRSAPLVSGQQSKLLVANAASMPLETLEALRVMNVGGRNVIFYGKLPDHQPGFLKAKENDQRIQKLAGEIAVTARAGDAEQLLAKLEPTFNITGDPSIRRISRHLPGGGLAHFLVNQSPDTVTATVQAMGRDLVWFDPVSKRAWAAEPEGGSVTLNPFEARFLLVDAALGVDVGAKPAHLQAPITSFPIPPEAWRLSHGGKDVLLGGTLPDWRDLAPLRHAGDEAVYTAVFDLASHSPSAVYMLDLGRVDGMVQLFVNGKAVENIFPGPYRVDISKWLRAGENTLKLHLSPPRWNSLVGRYNEGDPLAAQMKAQQEKLIPAGLRGPVVIHEYISEGAQQ